VTVNDPELTYTLPESDRLDPMKADIQQLFNWARRADQLQPKILRPDRKGAKGLRHGVAGQ
jgi:hypothetical protein